MSMFRPMPRLSPREDTSGPGEVSRALPNSAPDEASLTDHMHRNAHIAARLKKPVSSPSASRVTMLTTALAWIRH